MSYTDTANLDGIEKVDLLFKNYLGYMSTNTNLRFYDEGKKVNPNNYIDGKEIWIDELPNSSDNVDTYFKDYSFNDLIQIFFNQYAYNYRY